MINNNKIKVKLFFLLLFLLVITITGTFAYYTVKIISDQKSLINVNTENVPLLYFVNGTLINLIASQQNFTQVSGNLSASTISSAVLETRSSSTIVENYEVLLDIISNNYVYTTPFNQAELLMKVTAPDGTEITSITGLSYVTSGGVSGFDITTKTGTVSIASNYEIETSSIITQNWNVEIIFVNLETEQKANENKSFNAYLKLNKIYVYDYKNESQLFVAPYSGKYKIELWGAQGGIFNDLNGGFGSYTAGEINLNANDKFYVYVGGSSNNLSIGGYNGGGNGGNNSTGGGGATDIRLVSGLANNANSLNSRIMIAAGGGGINTYSTGSNGGSAGGLIGYHGLGRGVNAGPLGGTQFLAGTTDAANFPGEDGKFGIGGAAGTYGGGGGGGYYGGGGGSNQPQAGGGESSGAGGSSYISGHTGCLAIDDSSISEPRELKSGCTSTINTKLCSIHASGKEFTNTKMIDGMGYSWSIEKDVQEQMPTPNGGYYNLGVGHSGNGYAKITYIEKYDVEDYVQDNLILLYDGIRNNGETHTPSTNSWVDLSPSENNGILHNFTNNADNWVNNGLKFTSTQNYVITDTNSTDFSVFKSGKSFSYCSTFTTGASDIGSWQGVVSNMPSWGAGGFNIQYGTAQGVSLGFGLYLKGSTTHEYNKIYDVCGVYDGTIMRVYLNGEYKALASYSLKSGTNTLKLSCFYHKNTTVSLPMNGIIHNLMFYDKALSADEVYQNYLVNKYRYFGSLSNSVGRQ